MRTTAIDDPVAWASVSKFVCLSSGRLFLLVRQMAPVRCGRYYVTVANFSHILHRDTGGHERMGYTNYVDRAKLG